MSEWGPIIGWLILTPLAFYGAHCLHRDHLTPWIMGPFREWLFRVLCRWYGVKP